MKTLPFNIGKAKHCINSKRDYKDAYCLKNPKVIKIIN